MYVTFSCPLPRIHQLELHLIVCEKAEETFEVFSCVAKSTWQTLYSINMMVRGATELETHIVSVERIKEYTEIQSEVSQRAM